MNARNRRDLLNRELDALAQCLPLAGAITAQLDKASVIRLTSAYLALRNIFPRIGEKVDDLPEVGSFLLQTLDGFLIILDSCGRIMYVSETASVHLGLSQVELIGSSIFDFLHPGDYPLIKQILSVADSKYASSNECYIEEIERMFSIRLRCILPKRNAGITYNGFKTISFWGYSKVRHDRDESTSLGLIAVGYLLTKSGITEFKLTSSMFMFRARLDLTLIFVDSRVTGLTDFAASSLLDISLYQIVHLDDAHIIEGAHRTLLEKNQSTTRYYRLLHRTKGYVWVQTRFTIVPVLRATITHCIVAITEVFSSCEGDETLASIQLESEECASGSTLGVYSNLFYKGAPLANCPSKDH